jgi:serine/threonine protein phosphatase PrpC
LTKQLRLASAALTDIGRKRERNQDNVTSHVPPEPDIFEEKGALFVVCDGMGGHAAGEVAADLGVKTIRDVYFSMRGNDVITSIAHAVKSANEMIYSTARSTVEYGGMGTTCVALVVAGGRGYIVNIGDSRAYILRDGKVRQVTQDHSWVAEQVRGGILSEEQARIHAHRNVITRSLGTQPSITADLFVETLHDGDRVLLCTDGLHGYVEEAAIFQELIAQPSPDVTVRNLIDMANANGGPDNITAVVVDVLEAPEVTEPVPLPPNATTPIEEGETQPLPVPPGAAVVAPAASAMQTATGKAPSASKKAAKDAKDAKDAKKRKRRSGPAVVALRLLEIAALILIGVSIWYVGFGPLAAQRQADQRTQTALAQAQTVVQASATQNPTDALRALQAARTTLLADMASPAVDPSVRAQAQAFLDVQFASAVQSAIQRYDAAAGISHLGMNAANTYTLACASPGSATPAQVSSLSSLVALSAPAGKPSYAANAQLLYALSGGALYEITVPLDAAGNPAPGAIACQQLPLAGITSLTAITPNGAVLDALVKTSKGYAVVRITPLAATGGALPGVKVQSLFTAPVKSETPGALMANGSTVYLAFTGGATVPSGIWRFQIPSKGSPPAPKVIPTPQPVTSMRLAGGSVFLSLADGNLGQLDTALTFQPVSVLAPLPVTTANPSSYTAATPVPTVAAGVTPSPTAAATFGPGSTLVNDPLNPAQLLLADSGLHRIIRLVANTSGPGVGLSAQYVYSDVTPTFTSMALSGSGSTLQVYAWNGAQLLTLPIQESAA